MAKTQSKNPVVRALEKRRVALRLPLRQLAKMIINPVTGKPVRPMSLFRWTWGTSEPAEIYLKRWEAALTRLERR